MIRRIILACDAVHAFLIPVIVLGLFLLIMLHDGTTTVHFTER